MQSKKADQGIHQRRLYIEFHAFARLFVMRRPTSDRLKPGDLHDMDMDVDVDMSMATEPQASGSWSRCNNAIYGVGGHQLNKEQAELSVAGDVCIGIQFEIYINRRWLVTKKKSLPFGRF